MASSPSSPTATVSVSRRATVVASATRTPSSCRRASAASLSWTSSVTSAPEDTLARRASFALRAATKAKPPRGSQRPAASPAAGGAGARATTDSLVLETARASNSTSPAPDVVKADVPRARLSASSKTGCSARPSAIRVRWGLIEGRTTTQGAAKTANRTSTQPAAPKRVVRAS